MYLPMAKVPPIVNLSAEDQAQLVRWKSTQGTPQQVALRCRLVLAAAEGYPDLEIASHHEVNRHTVALWRERVQAKGIGSVWEIQAGRGRKPKYELEKRDALIRATLETKPKGMTQDRKSTRLNSSHPSISYAVFCLTKKRGGRRDDGCRGTGCGG